MEVCLWTVLFLLPSFGLANLTAEEASELPIGIFQVIRIRIENGDQLKLVDSLYKKAEELEVDFWQAPSAVGAVVDVMLSPGPPATRFLELLETAQLNSTLIIPDVQKLVLERKEKAELRQKLFPRLRDSSSRVYYDFTRYQEEDEMEDYMRRVEREYPDIARMEQIGTSHERRPIYVLKISNFRDGDWSKRGIWIDGGMHAREWAAPHVAIYFIHQVRMWRKNRNPNGCYEDKRKCCFGVDLNRNFDFHWLESGSSSNPCSEVYAGSVAFSEPESRAIRDFVLRQNRIDGFITLHTYSQLWVHAYGHEKGVYPPDKRDLAATARRAAKALQRLYGTQYKIGSGADALYPASGGSDDWAKDVAGIKFVYLLELRPSEDEWDGFILDEAELLPTSMETWEGVKVVAAEILLRAGKQLPPSMAMEVASTTTPPAQTTRSGGQCEDLRYSCARWASSGDNCLVVRKFMTEQCALSCSRYHAGFC